MAVYSYNYHPEPTGIAFYNTGLCRWLGRRGWDVSMHTGIPFYPTWRTPDGFAYRRSEIDDGVRVERVRQHVSARPDAVGRILLDATWILLTAARSLGARGRPDILLVIAPPFLSGLMALWLRLRWRCPVIYHVQDLQIDAAVDLGLLPRWLGCGLAAVERLVLRRVDLVSTISTAMRRRLAAKARTRQRIALIPNWVAPDSLRPSAGTNPFRASWAIPPEGTVVIYSGSIGRKQGLEDLLEAFAILRDRADIHFVIAGVGPGLADLRKKAEDSAIPRLRFEPLAPVEALGDFLGAADIHCIVQRAEAADLVLPSKLMNVMCVGRPVVATAAAGTELSAMVHLADCGLAVLPESPQAIANGIAHLASRPELRVRAGANAARFARTRIADRVVLPTLERHMHRLISQTRRSRP